MVAWRTLLVLAVLALLGALAPPPAFAVSIPDLDDVRDGVSDVLDRDDEDEDDEDSEEEDENDEDGSDDANGLLPGIELPGVPLPEDVAGRLPDAVGNSPSGLPSLDELLPGPDGLEFPPDNEPPPPGSNVDCTPSSDKPYPVVLVHGTFGGRFESWAYMSPQLKAEGYCVYAINYGRRATQEIEDSAEELDEFIDDVLDETGADKVSIVGHSQGGVMSRYYIKELEGEDKVEDLIGLAPSNHGTDQPLAPPAARLFNCPACAQQFPYQPEPDGDRFISNLNEGDETEGDISYTQVTTRFDEVVIPYYSGFLADDPDGRNGPESEKFNGEETTNFCLQDEFRGDTIEHNTIVGDPNALRVVEDALENDGPAEPPDEPDSECRGVSGEFGEDEEEDRDSRGDDDADRDSDDDDKGDDGKPGSPGNGPGDGDAPGTDGAAPGPLAPGPAAYCSAPAYAQNFAPAGSPAHRACLAAAEQVQSLDLAPAVACERAGLSRRVVPGEQRSDHSACVLALAAIQPAPPPL
jgi:pimeloyl-ACP methyl ester carboxylesterase